MELFVISISTLSLLLLLCLAPGDGTAGQDTYF